MMVMMAYLSGLRPMHHLKLSVLVLSVQMVHHLSSHNNNLCSRRIQCYNRSRQRKMIVRINTLPTNIVGIFNPSIRAV